MHNAHCAQTWSRLSLHYDQEWLCHCIFLAIWSMQNCKPYVMSGNFLKQVSYSEPTTSVSQHHRHWQEIKLGHFRRSRHSAETEESHCSRVSPSSWSTWLGSLAEASGIYGESSPTTKNKVLLSKQVSLAANVATDGFNLIELTADHTGRSEWSKGPLTSPSHTSCGTRHVLSPLETDQKSII